VGQQNFSASLLTLKDKKMSPYHALPQSKSRRAPLRDLIFEGTLGLLAHRSGGNGGLISELSVHFKGLTGTPTPLINS
jgi:hypothetical protein